MSRPESDATARGPEPGGWVDDAVTIAVLAAIPVAVMAIVGG